MVFQPASDRLILVVKCPAYNTLHLEPSKRVWGDFAFSNVSKLSTHYIRMYEHFHSELHLSGFRRKNCKPAKDFQLRTSYIARGRIKEK